MMMEMMRGTLKEYEGTHPVLKNGAFMKNILLAQKRAADVWHHDLHAVQSEDGRRIRLVLRPKENIAGKTRSPEETLRAYDEKIRWRRDDVELGAIKGSKFEFTGFGETRHLSDLEKVLDLARYFPKKLVKKRDGTLEYVPFTPDEIEVAAHNAYVLGRHSAISENALSKALESAGLAREKRTQILSAWEKNRKTGHGLELDEYLSRLEANKKQTANAVLRAMRYT